MAEEEVGQLGVEGAPRPVSLSPWEPLASRRVASTLCETEFQSPALLTDSPGGLHASSTVKAPIHLHMKKC